MDFFELVWMETESLTPGERQKDIAYTGILHIHLDERDNRTEDQQDLRPNGFTEPATMSDFPVRDRGEIVRKVKHSSVRIENPLLALHRGTGYFSLARTFRTVWGGWSCTYAGGGGLPRMAGA